MNRYPHAFRATPRLARGLSLIELMIALLLGLLVVGGAIGIFTSNRRAYNATESLSRVQENARVAFEMMSRDVREAGGERKDWRDAGMRGSVLRFMPGLRAWRTPHPCSRTWSKRGCRTRW